jgi:hypothetical protein
VGRQGQEAWLSDDPHKTDMSLEEKDDFWLEHSECSRKGNKICEEAVESTINILFI